jgi:hypothetical protein
MRATTILATTFLATVSPSAFAQNVSAGQWLRSTGQGMTEHEVEFSGNSFSFSCDVAATSNAERTQLLILIGERAPPPDGIVRVYVGRRTFEFGTDKNGSILTDFRVNAQAFVDLWTALRRGGPPMRVVFPDNRTATFPLAGARRVLPQKPCTTAFQGSK